MARPQRLNETQIAELFDPPNEPGTWCATSRCWRGSSFDLGVFLTTGNHGRSMSEQRAGQVLYAQGDAADSVFYIVRGKIKIAVTSGQGREAVVGLFGDKDFFGEGCLIGQPLRLATAVAMTDAAVLRIEKAEMIRVLHAEPAVAEVFTAHLLTRNSRVEADLVDHLFNSSERRLARVLLLLANFGKEGKPEPITTRALLQIRRRGGLMGPNVGEPSHVGLQGPPF